MNQPSQRTAFFISDGTGITSEALGKSLLSQFEGIEFERVTLPYIDTIEKAHAAVKQIAKAQQLDNARPIVFDTVLDHEIRGVLSASGAFFADVFGTFLEPLELELNMKSSYRVGRSHSIVNDKGYMDRIAAVHFALDNDDGARTMHYEKADIILIGVSRSGKTPTCLYLGMQYGVSAANYPLTEDDTDSCQLPKLLKPYRDKLFGLTIDSERLAAIRNERRANSQYASFRQCELEVRGAQALYSREKIPFIDSTHHSVEEIASHILVKAGMKGYLKNQLS